MNTENTDALYMRRCLELARLGHLHASPNPMVGAVIVCQGRIIGEGYHAVCGKGHAEGNAINSVRPADRPLLKQSTIYVSLEPCAHYGKTPPCARLIVQTGIPRVVVGCIDPFAKVQGRGIAILREAGIEVKVGVLEAECQALNRRFFTAQTLHRPYITLKWARSADGFLDRWRFEEENGIENDLSEECISQECHSKAPAGPSVRPSVRPAKLSSPWSIMRVHQLRAMHQAILVGHGTLRLDHPQLNVRHWAGPQPVRVVLGRVAEGELPAGWLAYADIETALSELYHTEGVQSILVEGGQQTLQSFIDQGLWDEAYVELSSQSLGSGVPEPRMPVGVRLTEEHYFGATVWHYEPETVQR